MNRQEMMRLYFNFVRAIPTYIEELQIIIDLIVSKEEKPLKIKHKLEIIKSKLIKNGELLHTDIMEYDNVGITIKYLGCDIGDLSRAAKKIKLNDDISSKLDILASRIIRDLD